MIGTKEYVYNLVLFCEEEKFWVLQITEPKATVHSATRTRQCRTTQLYLLHPLHVSLVSTVISHVARRASRSSWQSDPH